MSDRKLIIQKVMPNGCDSAIIFTIDVVIGGIEKVAFEYHQLANYSSEPT